MVLLPSNGYQKQQHQTLLAMPTPKGYRTATLGAAAAQWHSPLGGRSDSAEWYGKCVRFRVPVPRWGLWR